MAALRKPPVRLAVAPAAQAYEVGQPIAVRVVAVGVEDVAIRQARADLVMRVWLRVPQPLAGQWGAAPPDKSPQRTITGTGSYLSLPGSLAAGARADCEAVLPNWATAPSGGLPPGPRIEYSVRAELGLADGRTVRGEAPVRLLSGPSLYQTLEGKAHWRRLPRRGDLELVMPVMRARPGETLRGTLRVVPHQPMRARSVSMLLGRRQSVPRRWRRMWRQNLAKDADLAGPREFPFEVQLPRDVPTMITPYLSVRWYLQAVVRYGLVAADRCEWQLNVYTGPP
jgi:hypothetical protein